MGINGGGRDTLWTDAIFSPLKTAKYPDTHKLTYQLNNPFPLLPKMQSVILSSALFAALASASPSPGGYGYAVVKPTLSTSVAAYIPMTSTVTETVKPAVTTSASHAYAPYSAAPVPVSSAAPVASVVPDAYPAKPIETTAAADAAQTTSPVYSAASPESMAPVSLLLAIAAAAFM